MTNRFLAFAFTILIICFVLVRPDSIRAEELPNAKAASLLVQQQADRLLIGLGEHTVAEFVFDDPQILRPYFSNLRTPSGIKVTRNHPPVDGQDQLDHASMHPGVWLGFGTINGVDFWRNKGSIKHQGFNLTPVATEDLVEFATRSTLVDPTGRTLGKLDSHFQFRHVKSGFVLIWMADITALEQSLEFGDQEEMGFGVRVASKITEKNGGKIRSSTGAESAKATWGKQAAWCDYAGVADNASIGITSMVIGDSKNWWHNRDYGLMVANQFGRAAMKQGDPLVTRIESGKRIRLTYGIAIHEAEDYSAEQQFRTFSELVEKLPTTTR